MTPSEREWGALERTVVEIRHDLRNTRTVTQHLGEEIDRLRGDFERFKTRVATGAAALVLVAGVVGWLVEVLVR